MNLFVCNTSFHSFYFHFLLKVNKGSILPAEQSRRQLTKAFIFRSPISEVLTKSPQQMHGSCPSVNDSVTA